MALYRQCQECNTTYIRPLHLIADSFLCEQCGHRFPLLTEQVIGVLSILSRRATIDFTIVRENNINGKSTFLIRI